MAAIQQILAALKATAASGLTFVGSASAAGGSSAVVTLPAGVQEGDLVVVCSFSTTTPSTPSGYTQQAAHSVAFPGGGNAVGRVFTKVMGPTPDTSVTVTATFATAAVHVWRGVNATPMDATPTTSNTSNCPSITPVTSGAVVLAFSGGGFVSSSTLTTPTGYSNVKLQNQTGSHDSVDTYYYISAVASKAWTSGAEDPNGFTPSSNTGADAGFGITLALRPA